MVSRLTDPGWTETQRQFVEALERAGATKPEHAVPIDQTPALPVRELQALVDSGLVREASSNGYYLYPRQSRAEMGRVMTDVIADAQRMRDVSQKRMVKTIVFWLLIMLIPILFIQFTT